MSALNAFEETPHFANFAAPGVTEFIAEVDYLMELAVGEMTTQSIFEIKQILQRLGVQTKALRPEPSST